MKRINKACLPLLAAIFAMLLLMGGCAGMNELQNKIEQTISDNKDIFLTHMEEKYGIPFLPISYTSSGVMVNEEFRCYAEGTDRERDYVRVFREEKDGEEVYYDDYFGVLIRDEYQRRVQELCEQVVGASKAYLYRYSVSFFDNSLTAESTIDDAITMNVPLNASKYVFFEVEPGSEAAFAASCDRICQSLAQSKLAGIVKFVGLAKGQLENVSEENYLSYIPDLIKTDGVICLMMDDRAVKAQ